jgi:hypothetical protein
MRYVGNRIFLSCFRGLKKICVHALTIIIFAPTFISIWEDRPIRDPFSYYLVGWDDTQYSNGYSQAEFNNIKIGDRVDEINQKLGMPLFTVANDDCTTCSEDDRNESSNFYTNSGRRSNYWFIASVTYDKRTGRVKKKHLRFED